MRIYVSIDAEGLPGVFHPSQLTPRGYLFNEMKKVVTQVAKTVAKALHERGVEEVWIADSHGFMGNIDYLEMPSYVKLLRGALRPVSMVYGIDRGFDAAIFLGYHSGAGVPRSVADHTFSGRSIHEVRINGVPVSEFVLNALVAGAHGVPVVLVMGDDKLREEVSRWCPWCIYVVSKESISRFAAIMKPLDVVLKELENGVEQALKKLRRGEAKPLRIDGELVLEIVVRRTELADVAELIPGIERVGGYVLRYRTKSVEDLYRIVELVALLGVAVEELKNSVSYESSWYRP